MSRKLRQLLPGPLSCLQTELLKFTALSCTNTFHFVEYLDWAISIC